VAVEGVLRAVESVDVGPPALSMVYEFKLAMLAPEGSEVTAGEPVMRFDTTQLQQRLQELIAERDATLSLLEKRTADYAIERRDTELELAEARAELRRAEFELAVPEEVAARRELERARIDHRLAVQRIRALEGRLGHLESRRRAELGDVANKSEQAEARVEEVESAIERMTVRAPRAGTVIYNTRRRGEKPKVGDTVWRTQDVLSIPDLDRMRAEGRVAEADVGRLAVGQPVTLRLDSYPDVEYRGRLRRIGRAVENRSRHSPEKVVAVEIDLERTDASRMRPGMRFRGRVEVDRVEGVLTAPAGAVFPTADGAAVHRRTLLGRELLHPTLGRRNDELFEVVSGLEEGDRVLVRAAGEGAP
jgi:multidrug resistance efflux pump